jgi:hypothetical protein
LILFDFCNHIDSKPSDESGSSDETCYERVVTGQKFLNQSGLVGSKFGPVLSGQLKKLPRPVKTGKN